ncbi:MAG: hypothetical protein ACXWTW_04315 [Methylobacter sp.]
MNKNSVIPAWIAGIQFTGKLRKPPSLDSGFRHSLPERRKESMWYELAGDYRSRNFGFFVFHVAGAIICEL